MPHASTSLADLLPAVRYADPHRLAALLEDRRLPLGWWHATALMEVERVTGAEALSRLVARSLRALWPHAELGDVIPVLRLLDGPGVTGPGRTVAQVAGGTTGPSGAADGDGDEALARLFARVLDRLHGRGTVAEGTGEGVAESAAESDPWTAAVAVIAAWLPEDAPAEVRAALAVLQGPSAAPRRAAPAIAGADDGSGAPEEERDREREGEREPGPEPAAEPAEPDPRPAVEVSGLPEPVTPALMEAPLAAFDGLTAAWDERTVVIAGQRIFTGRPETLGALGERFSVSRERIRQQERGIAQIVHRWLAGSADGGGAGRAFAGHLAAVAERLGSVATVGEAHALHPDHTALVGTLGVPLGDVVARLLPDRTVDSGWIVRGDPAELRSAMREELLAACGETPLGWEEAVALGARFGVRGEVLGDWAAEIGRFRVMEGRLVHWGRSVNDRAAAVLALHGAPLPMEAIHEKLADGTAFSSVRSQIWIDERFIRLGRNLYGLRRWGGEEYLGIREMIVREIERAGGEAEINTIISTLTTRFDVSAASVRTNVNAPGFARSRRGWLCLAEQTDSGSDAPYVPRNDVAGTRRCFVGTDGRWWYRLEVNAEHLRGSGTPVPAGWAAHLGGSPLCEPLAFTHDAGETTLQWRTQPLLGSIRPLLERIGAEAGDHAFFNVTDGRLSALRLVAPEPETRPEAFAARLTGWTPDVTPAEAVAVIGRRIGMAPGYDAASLLERLAERGDQDIAELLDRAFAGAVPVSLPPSGLVEPAGGGGPRAHEEARS
ncbi:hypothetical protein [Streptomyces sp. NPDC001985]|uniref:hypothetical protein n=1 Tax=Streptomyces sp. NPDC001985 TaxID=3154406 RepID=UPI0033290D44